MKELKDAKYWEIREQNVNSESFSAWNSHIKSIESQTKQGTSVRVLYGNGWGFAYSYEKDIEKIAKDAMNMAKIMDKKSKIKKEIMPCKAIKAHKKSKFKIDNQDIDISEKRKLVLENSLPLRKKIKNCQASYSEIHRSMLYTNSEGSRIKQDLKSSYILVNATAKSNGKIESFSDRIGVQAGYELTNKFPAVLKTATQKAIAMLDAKLPKAGNMPVICDGALTDVFIHEALGHAAEADHIMQNSSCLKGLIGKKIAPDFVSVYDDASMKGLWGSYFFDDEGVKAQKTSLIKNGILKGFMHSRETASELKAKVTGNARAQSAAHIPQVRMSNTYIEKGPDDFDDMIQNVKKGIFLKGSLGGQVDPTNGNFLFSAQEGFEIKNGKLGNRLKQVAISGNTLQTLSNISMVSNKYEKSFAGHCGKGGQYVPVYGPCPSILISKAKIGGA